MVIGLTGGILSGKSTVSQILRQHGAVVIDADKIGHDLYIRDTETWKEVVSAFGSSILAPNGEIDRSELSNIVFNDFQALKKLEQIMHPKMYKTIKDRILELQDNGVEVIVLEAAVLLEANWNDLFDTIWVTVAPENVIIQRLKNRVGLTEEQARKRIGAQMSLEQRIQHADVVINTDCSIEEIKVNIEKLWRGLLNKS